MRNSDPRDIALRVDVNYTNLGTREMSPPDQMRFEFQGKAYPAAFTDQFKEPGKRDASDGPIPAGVPAEGVITGTLDDVVKTDPPSSDEQHDILVQTQLVVGASETNQAVFPFTQREPG